MCALLIHALKVAYLFNLFQPFVCEMPLDLNKCLKNNIHNRTEMDIQRAIKEWNPTPSAYTILDYQCLFGSGAVDTEAISDAEDEKAENFDALDAISDDENAKNRNQNDDFSDIEGDEEPINEVRF